MRTRKNKYFGWRWFAELLKMNCGPSWTTQWKEPICVVLAKEIHRRHPKLEYEEILYRVALLYDAVKK